MLVGLLPGVETPGFMPVPLRGVKTGDVYKRLGFSPRLYAYAPFGAPRADPPAEQDRGGSASYLFFWSPLSP